MIEINGNKYEALKMTPREQFHVMRRLAPLVGTMGEGIFALLDKERDQKQVMAELAATIGPLTEVLATLPDETVDYVLDACLVHMQRQTPGVDGWFPIYVKQPRGALRMFQDIDGMTELRLVSEAIKVNLSGFFGQLSGASASPLSAVGVAQASNT